MIISLRQVGRIVGKVSFELSDLSFLSIKVIHTKDNVKILWMLKDIDN